MKTKMESSKKSQIGEKFVIILILVMIFAAVTFIFTDKIFDSAKEQTPKQICKASVYKAYMSGFQGTPFNDEILCPTQNVTIKSKDRAVVKEEIANYMYDCYDQFWQGKYEIFTGKDVATYCAICHIIKLEKTPTIQLSEFTNYLHKTKIPSSNLTYESYLAGYTTNTQVMDEFSKQIDSVSYDLKSGENYTTMFIYARKGYKGQMESTGDGLLIGAGTGMVLSIVLIPFTGGGSLLLGLATIAGGTTGAIIGYNSASPVGQDWRASVTLMPYNKDQLNQIGCSELPASQRKDLIRTNPN